MHQPLEADRQNDRPLPHSLEAERGVLGACLLNAEAFDQAAAVVGDRDFFRDAHRRIWKAFEQLHDRGVAIDLVTVANELGEHLEAVGGHAYITGLVDGVPRSTNVEYYAGIVRDKAAHRRRILAARKVLDHLNQGAGPVPDDVLDVVRGGDTVAAGGDEGPPWQWGDTLNATAEQPRYEPAGRGVLAFAGKSSTITATAKQGKSTAIWTDLAPSLMAGKKALAIVGRSELGGSRADYAQDSILPVGGVEALANVAFMDPPTDLDRFAAQLADADPFDFIVLDSAASLCAATGINGNLDADVKKFFEQHWLVWPLAEGGSRLMVRHDVTSFQDRNPTASKGAGSGQWAASADAEGHLIRDGDTTSIEWAARNGCPDRTGFRLDKSVYPYLVEVLTDEDLTPPPTGGGPGGGGVTDEAAEQAVLGALRDATPDQPLLMGGLKTAIAEGRGITAKDGRWFSPYRDAVDRLHAAGELASNRNPSTRKAGGGPLRMWLSAGINRNQPQPPVDSRENQPTGNDGDVVPIPMVDSPAGDSVDSTNHPAVVDSQGDDMPTFDPAAAFLPNQREVRPGGPDYDQLLEHAIRQHVHEANVTDHANQALIFAKLLGYLPDSMHPEHWGKEPPPPDGSFSRSIPGCPSSRPKRYTPMLTRSHAEAASPRLPES